MAVVLQLLTPIGTNVQVEAPVDFGFKNFPSSKIYNQVLQGLSNSGLETRRISQQESVGLFVERAADFIAIRALNAVGSGPPTSNVTVKTNRSGDQGIYAEGYFHSNQTGFGISTPAYGHLQSGRYDFGVSIAGSARWNGVLWVIPAAAPIMVPLP